MTMGEQVGNQGAAQATGAADSTGGAATSDKTQNQAGQQSGMSDHIPKERFNEVNEARKTAEAEAQRLKEALGYAQNDPAGFARAMWGDDAAKALESLQGQQEGAAGDDDERVSKTQKKPLRPDPLRAELDGLYNAMGQLSVEVLGPQACEGKQFVDWKKDRAEIINLTKVRRVDYATAADLLNAQRMTDKLNQVASDQQKQGSGFAEGGQRATAPADAQQVAQAEADYKRQGRWDEAAFVDLIAKKFGGLTKTP